jgi:hypothetical protein
MLRLSEGASAEQQCYRCDSRDLGNESLVELRKSFSRYQVDARYQYNVALFYSRFE